MSGALAASVFDGLLRGHVAEDPVEEAALVARADEDLARAAELEHDAFARRLAVDELAEEAALARVDAQVVAQACVPGDEVAVVDRDRALGRDVELADGAEARDGDAAAALGAHHEEAAGVAEQRAADSLGLRREFDALGAGEKGAVREQVLRGTHVEDAHVAGKVRREEHRARLVVRLDPLLEERLVVHELAGDRAHEAAAGLSLEGERRVHGDHGVRLGENCLALLKRHRKERIDPARNLKSSHLVVSGSDSMIMQL